MRQMMAVILAIMLILGAGAALAQAPAGEKAAPQATAPPAQPAPAQPPAAGAGMSCPCMQMMSQGQMTPEAMKQMHEKMGQMCAMMAQGKGCPMMQEFKKQLDDLNKRVEALEGKGKAKQK